jgi:hypothetical protein
LVCRCEEPDCICAAGRQPPPAALSEANLQKARAAGVEQRVSAQLCVSAAPKRHLAAIVADSGLGLVALHNIKKEPGQEPSAANRQQHDTVKDSDQAVADLADLADPAGAIAAAAAAQQRASAVPKHVQPASGNNQAVDDEVESGEEEDREPVAKRRKKIVATSGFVGVGRAKKDDKWRAQINKQHLGYFNDEHEAARAFDTAARRLRGDDAHGGRPGSNRAKWFRLNFPTEGEMKRAQNRGALLTKEDKAAAVAASEQQGPSKFVGVSWDKRTRKWRAEIRHDGKTHNLGHFNVEREAARAFDTAARRLRGDDAHGGRSGSNRAKWFRLNFPTEGEMKRAQNRGALLTKEDKALLTKEDKAAAVAASEQQGKERSDMAAEFPHRGGGEKST